MVNRIAAICFYYTYCTLQKYRTLEERNQIARTCMCHLELETISHLAKLSLQKSCLLQSQDSMRIINTISFHSSLVQFYFDCPAVLFFTSVAPLLLLAIPVSMGPPAPSPALKKKHLIEQFFKIETRLQNMLNNTMHTFLIRPITGIKLLSPSLPENSPWNAALLLKC